MKLKFILATILLILFLPTGVFAQDFSIKAEVDKIKITTDDSITYKLIITSSAKKIPRPTLPKFEGFRGISNAQSSTISFVKGGVRGILVYAYILVPKDIGKFKIEPSQIKLEGKTYSSEAFEIEVIQGKAKPQIPPQEKPLLPKETPGESEQTTL